MDPLTETPLAARVCAKDAGIELSSGQLGNVYILHLLVT